MAKDSQPADDSPAWRQLAEHARLLSDVSLAELLADSQRYTDFSCELDGIAVDFSRCLITAETLGHLEALATECELSGHIQQLFDGAIVNSTEKRAALHTALRGTATRSSGVPELVNEQLEAFLRFADDVRGGTVRSNSGQPFRTVINIGIGGSDLGPRLVARAVASHAEPVAVHFVAGVDGIELADALAEADPAETLFVICSKTFSTLETRVNADAARAWLLNSQPESAVARHFAAVSTNDPAMDEFGIAQNRRFRIWDWVGGRYSVWSAVGLAAAIAIGSDRFREFLAGARSMDEHFLQAPFNENLPILLGMLGIWNQNLLALDTTVVLPYDQRLEDLPGYLQQLYMESQGKAVRMNGTDTAVPAGKALWGATGSHAQHSFAQWLHQGDAHVVVEYVGVVQGPPVQAADGRLLALANMIAQAEALAHGQDATAVRKELTAAGVAGAELEALLPHKVHPGNRASIVLLLRELDARTLGALLALYEHRVFVQAVIWGINPFDQWGVELGKVRASQFARDLRDKARERLPGIAGLVLDWTESCKT